MNDQEKNQLEEKFLHDIASGKLKMKPRWHFILQAALLIVGIFIIFLTLLYLSSCIIFLLHQSGVWFLPSFGFRGVYAFISHLPWLLLLFLIVFMVLLEILIKRYSISYRSPLIYTILGIVLIVVIGGFCVQMTDFHLNLSRFAQDNRLPLAEPFYRHYGRQRFDNVYQGIVVTTTAYGFILMDIDGHELNIILPNQSTTTINSEYSKGNNVVIFGDRDRDDIQAIGVRRIDN